MIEYLISNSQSLGINLIAVPNMVYTDKDINLNSS